MPKSPLTKSYVDRRNPKKPPPQDITLYQLWDKARKDGFVGNILNLETGERMTNIEILLLADTFAKGMLALGLKPGQGSIAVIGCTSLYAGVGMYVAANSIGVAFSHPSLFDPYETSIADTLNLADCSLLVVGKGNNGAVFSALTSMFDEDSSTVEMLKSDRLPCVQQIFYDSTIGDRSSSTSYLRNLSALASIGESISDEQLNEAKRQVNPSDIMIHLFSSGSTGHPKCIAHSFSSAANNALFLKPSGLPCVICTNVNNDELVAVSAVSVMLAGKFKNLVMAPDMGTTRPVDEFGKLCFEGIIGEKVQVLAIVPGMQQEIIKYCETNKMKIPPMLYSLFGGQIITRGFKQKLLSAFKGIAWTVYGMSEIGCSHWSSLKEGPEAEEARLNSLIKTAPSTETRIVDQSGEVVDIGVEGEVQYKGPTILKSYPKNEEIFKHFITCDGFVHTGDMGLMNPDGTIIIKGRVADAMRFKVFAKVVYPAPIEEAFGSHPSIKDISVVSGNSNGWMGDEVTYCICLMPEAKEFDEDDLMKHLTTNGLTHQYSPCRIIYFDAFPRTPNGRKVSKSRLREEVARRIAEDPLVGVTKAFRELAKKYGGEIGQ